MCTFTQTEIELMKVNVYNIIALSRVGPLEGYLRFSLGNHI